MNFLVIGAGLIGQERIKALLKLGYKNIYVHDTDVPKNLDKNIKIADKYTFKSKAPDWVFIAVPHSYTEPWVRVAAEWGSKILVEKPFGRNYQEAKEIYSHLKYPEQLFVGFNYRFYPGINRLCEDIVFNKFGKIISINMTLGHGGKPEDISSWKLNTFDGSSDCLLDPAIHFLDIINMMFPYAAKPLFGKYWGGFWNTGIKEEVHMLYDINGFIVNLQTSLVRWKSEFRIEVNGTKGYGVVTGKGRSYGEQRYVTGERWAWKKGKKQEDTEKLIIQSDCSDSFYLETKSLLSLHINNCTAIQALETMKLYDKSIRMLS